MSARLRILVALRHEEKTPRQLADELFINIVDVKKHLCDLCADKLVHRMFFHNTVTNKPDFKYSSVRYQKRYRDDSPSNAVLSDVVGAWDVIDMHKQAKRESKGK
jgi:predicted ArsR family transcriptional regulator